MSVAPLNDESSAQAKADILNLLTWLDSLSPDAVVRFRQVLHDETALLCQRIAEQIAANIPLSPDDSASTYFARPVFMSVITTQKQRVRRSASGTYRLYYELLDVDRDGRVDTLRFVSVRHAAARPLSVEGDGEETV